MSAADIAPENNVVSALHQQLALMGSLSISQFMDIALHHPQAGYYQRPHAIGAEGDFITAPEASQMFGELIGLWSALTWQQLGAPNPCLWVELGPGRGTLMQDALRAAKGVPAFLQAASVHLLERNAGQRALQQARLSDYSVRWCETIEDLPDQPALIIANEFFDALPILQFQRLPDGWCERRIVADGDGFAFALLPVAPPPASLGEHLRDLPPGSMLEISPQREAVMAGLANHLRRHGGTALLIDYGYDSPPTGDTLQALRQHRVCDVLDRPGEADITAHVDFASLRRVAKAADLHAFGPHPQAGYLKAMGIDARWQNLRQQATPAQQAALDRGYRRLTDDDGMGRLFQCLAISTHSIPPPAFDTCDT